MSLINCECCGKEISEDSISCIHCGHPIKEKNYELLFSYQYNGKVINSPLYRDNIEKLDLLQKIMKVELYNKVYKIVDFVCSAHNEIIRVVLEDD